MKSFVTLIIFSVTTTLFAGNPATIRACGDVGFTKNRDLNICMKSGAEAEAVIACSKINTSDMSVVNECITSGATKDKITGCAQSTSDTSNFSSCIKS